MGERGVRNAEVRGSIPLISTISFDPPMMSLGGMYDNSPAARIIYDFYPFKRFFPDNETIS